MQRAFLRDSLHYSAVRLPHLTSWGRARAIESKQAIDLHARFVHTSMEIRSEAHVRVRREIVDEEIQLGNLS